MKRINTKKITTLALLTAMSVVASLLIRIPLVPAVPFLKFDPKDVIIAIGGFIYGPMSAVVVSMLASALELLLTGGNWIDWIMNVISTLSFVLPAAFLYRRMHSKSGAFIGLVLGIVLNIVAMVVWNYIMDPIYFHMERSAVVAMLPAVGLFNLIKCSINTCITLFVYKPVVTALRSSGLVEKSAFTSTKKSLVIVSAFTAATALLALVSAVGFF